ncbi:unnamed protein product [Meloidogyne enterolobii]|uniref:Uncharacterized protein n=1 Tax=Meloidogyne enterolobii TaxID=390850 RepID=A0ACB0ZDV8_MELEN
MAARLVGRVPGREPHQNEKKKLGLETGSRADLEQKSRLELDSRTTIHVWSLVGIPITL